MIGVGRCPGTRMALPVYALSAIGPAERLLVRWHLAGCSGCRHELADLSAVVSLLRLVPADDAIRLLDRVR